jgi:hypothetical protein
MLNSDEACQKHCPHEIWQENLRAVRKIRNIQISKCKCLPTGKKYQFSDLFVYPPTRNVYFSI